MKTIFLISFLFLTSFSFAQEYKKDTRTKLQKQDPQNSFQTDLKLDIDLLKALELAGINIFKIPLPPFDKKLKFSMTIDEYSNGEKINSKKVPFGNDNTYSHFIKTDSVQLKRYYDYIDDITFLTKDEDSVCKLSIHTYGRGVSGLKLMKKKDTENQFYEWRYYGKDNLKLNEDIQMLVFASSWYDKNIGYERFCGSPFDLSSDKTESAILFDNSPHYYIISYHLSEL